MGLQVFNVTPSHHFVSNEAQLQKRCKDNGVSYIQPKPTDLVDETVARKNDHKDGCTDEEKGRYE